MLSGKRLRGSPSCGPWGRRGLGRMMGVLAQGDALNFEDIVVAVDRNVDACCEK